VAEVVIGFVMPMTALSSGDPNAPEELSGQVFAATS